MTSAPQGSKFYLTATPRLVQVWESFSQPVPSISRSMVKNVELVCVVFEAEDGVCWATVPYRFNLLYFINSQAKLKLGDLLYQLPSRIQNSPYQLSRPLTNPYLIKELTIEQADITLGLLSREV